MRATRALVFAGRSTLPVLVAIVAGCGPVNVATDSAVPVALVEPMPIAVGIYYSEDFSKAAHNEERWGTDWKVDLGPYHVRMAEKLFASEFRETTRVEDLKSLPADPPYRAIIEPRIEQYSFITPRDTGAKYFAVTIRYRLNVYTPNGVLADSLTFTGYGSNGSGNGMTSTGPMVLATKAAMRDAAAKFLVQFPEQDVAKKLLAGQPLIDEAPQVAVQTGQGNAPGATPTAPVSPPSGSAPIESVPILDPTAEGAAPTPTTATPPAANSESTTTAPPTPAAGSESAPTPPETQPESAPAPETPAPVPESPKISPPQTTQPPRQGSQLRT
jgi:hypothetical protein